VTSYGPFGVLNFNTTADASGNYAFAALPVGDLQISVRQGNILGVRSLSLTASGSTVDVQLGTAVLLPDILQGSDTSKYDVQCDGDLLDGGYGPANDAYDGAYHVSVNGVQFPCVSSGIPQLSGREVDLGPQTLAGLQVTRHIYVPAEGGYARYLETLTNPTTTAVVVPVTVFSNLGSDSWTHIYIAPSANGNEYAVTQDDGHDPALAHVFGGSGAAITNTNHFVEHDDNISYTWMVTVPAGGHVSLVHFAVQRTTGDVQSAQAQAAALASGTQSGIWNGLSADERASILNFVVGQ
jgi:hypothetical protein